MARKDAPKGETPVRVRGLAAPLTPTLPAWVPAVVYAAVTVLLFRDFFFSGTAMLGTDSMALSYFARSFYTEFVQQFHRMPYWNPLLFGGIPFLEGMHGDILYPPSLAMFFLDARAMWGWKMSLHIFMAGIFTYLWLHRGLKLDRLPAFFGGLVFMMGADLVSLVYPGGDGKLFVSALAPLLFWLTERAVSSRRASDFAILSLGLALAVFTSHMQAVYYAIWGISLYFFFRVWQTWHAERNGALAARLVGMFALAGVLGVGAAAVQILPPLEYLQETSHRADRAAQGERSYEWSSTYSLNAEEVMSLVVPEFIGDVVGGTYWGKNGFKLNHEYAGLVPLLMIPLLLMRRRTPQVWFFIGLTVLTLLYALAGNTPFGRLFYLIPGVKLFRAWSIIIFLYGFCVATLGAIGLQHLQDRLTSVRTDADARGIDRTLWVTAGVFLVLAFLASSGVLMNMWTAVFSRGITPVQAQTLQAAEPYIQMGFWFAFLIALAVAGLWQMASRGVLSPRMLLLGLSLLAAVDLYREGRPFVAVTSLMNEQQAASGTLFRADDILGALQQLRDQGGIFRVADLGPPLNAGAVYGQNDLAVHGIEQLGGHHGNEIGRYRSLIGGDELATMMPSELRLANVTNTEYLVIPGQVADPRLEQVYVSPRGAVLYRNRDALPRAYVVGNTEIVQGAAAEITRLLSREFDARTTALLDAPLPSGVDVQPGATGTVQWVKRDVDDMTLRVNVDRPALLMLLDNYYPAWEATVDGNEVPIVRANYTFRAIPVPAGDHTVRVYYYPGAIRKGATISIGILLLLVAVIAAGAFKSRREEAVPAEA